MKEEYLQKFLEYIVAEKGYSPRTVETYRSALLDFSTFCTELDSQLSWANIDTDIIRQWIATRAEQGLDMRTMKKKLSAIRSFYRYMLRMGHVKKNPGHMVANPKVAKRLPQFLKQSEADKIFDQLEFNEDFEGQRDRLILLIFYSTGIRLSELVGLNIENISLSTSELKVLGKRNKERIIPFGNELRQAISHFLPLRQEITRISTGPLITDLKGGRIRREQVGQIVKKNLTAVTSVKKRTPHTLRHTFATTMLNNGADIRAVQELLGHESLVTTEVYTHVSFAQLRKEYEKAHPREKE